MKAIYILPALGIGGVEAGLRKAYKEIAKDVDLEVFTLDSSVENIQGVPSRCLSVRELLEITRLPRRGCVVITSLWRAHLIGMLLWVFGFKWITFFHNPCKGHVFDKAICRISYRLSTHSFFDSIVTSEEYLSQYRKKQTTVVPFLFRVELSAEDIYESQKRRYDVIFVGRHVELKRLDLICKIARYVIDRDKGFRIAFVGDGPTVRIVSALRDSYPDNVTQFGLLDNDKAQAIMKESKMIICASDYEGMAMSIIEGIQSGCVPVVRMVGEISKYASTKSAVLIYPGMSMQEVFLEMMPIRACDSIRRQYNSFARKEILRYKDYASQFLQGLESLDALRSGPSR